MPDPSFKIHDYRDPYLNPRQPRRYRRTPNLHDHPRFRRLPPSAVEWALLAVGSFLVALLVLQMVTAP